VPVSSVLGFWAVAALLIVVPGPDWAFAISAGLRRHVLPAAGGIVLGYVLMTVAVAVGIGLLVGSTPLALTALTLAGGIYLIWLGTRTVRRPATVNRTGEAPTRGAHTTVLQGMAVSGLNPKGLLVFVALLPQFAAPDAAWPMPIQLAVLGLVFSLTCGVVYLAVGAGARAVVHARPAAARFVSRISGASMVVLGVVLLAEHIASQPP
jgi:threonine/homoserine/homoserine lactone efflux protein